MRYEMRLKPLPFSQIEEGKKTLEVRLYDSKRQLLQIGDEILFYNRENAEQTLLKTIKDLRRYPSFKDMAENENYKLCGFNVSDTIQDVINCYHTYYSPEEEAEFGVLVIELN